MKTKIKLLLVFLISAISAGAQNSVSTETIPTNEWAKNPATKIYSLEQERINKEKMFKQTQKKFTSGVDINRTLKDLKNVDTEKRLAAVKILGLLTSKNYSSKIRNLLSNDPSIEVRIECARALKYLKSKKSIPTLIKELKTEDNKLKTEIALTLAALGEKTESFKALNETRRTGDWKLALDIHLGYLDLATEDAIEKLKSDLNDDNSFVAVDAAIILAELKHYKEAYPILKLKLKDEDKYVRMAAIRGLAYIGNSNSINLIRDMLNDSDPMVSERSASVIKNCHLN
jgi:HEAT repeat protein